MILKLIVNTDLNFDGKLRLQWESIDDPALKLDGNTLMVVDTNSSYFLEPNLTDTLQPLNTSAVVDLSVPSNNYHIRRYSVAVSGDVFRWIMDFGNESLIRKVRDILF